MITLLQLPGVDNLKEPKACWKPDNLPEAVERSIDWASELKLQLHKKEHLTKTVHSSL